LKSAILAAISCGNSYLAVPVVIAAPAGRIAYVLQSSAEKPLQNIAMMTDWITGD